MPSVGGSTRQSLEYDFSPIPYATIVRPARIGFKPPKIAVGPHNVEAFLEDAVNAPICAIDTETTSLEIDILDIVSMQVRTPTANYVIPFSHHRMDNVAFAQVKPFIDSLIKKERVYVYNMSFDIPVIEKFWPSFDFCQFTSQVVDVSELCFLADTNHPYPTLKNMEQLFLGVTAKTFSDTFGDNDIRDTAPETFCEYAAYDSWGTYELGEHLFPILSKQYPFLVKLDRRFLPVLHRLQKTEQVIDVKRLDASIRDLQSQLQEVQSKFYSNYGMVNYRSPKVLRELLLSRGYNTGVMTPGGKAGKPEMSVGAKALQKLGEHCELAQLLIKISKTEKLLNSFFEKLQKRVQSGVPVRIHYNNKRIMTYRLAAGGYNNKEKMFKETGHFLSLNMQAIPKPYSINRRLDFDYNTLQFEWDNPDGEFLVETGSPVNNFRANFTVPDNYFVISNDLSGEELRIITNLSLEPSWMNEFLHGIGDIHQATADAIWGKGADKNKRKIAKSINFALTYGGTGFAIAKNANIPVDQADEFYNRAMGGLKGLRAWMDKQAVMARHYGYIVNPFGLLAHVKEYYRRGGKFASYADRLASNFPVQSSGGIVLRSAMIKMDDWLRTVPTIDGIPAVYFLDTVHDEICDAAHRDWVLSTLQTQIKAMESSWPSTFPVPLKADSAIGKNLGELIPIYLDDSSPCGFRIAAIEDKEAQVTVLADILPDVDDENEGDLVGGFLSV